MYSCDEIRKFEKRLRAYRGIENALNALHDRLLEIRNNIELSGGSTNVFNGGGMDSNSREKSLFWFLSKEEDLAKAIRKKENEYIILKMAFSCLDDEGQRIIDKFYFQNKSITSICKDLHYSEATIKRKKKNALYIMMDFIRSEKANK